jgi:drug/metabolite transporter (DMT)-like permease
MFSSARTTGIAAAVITVLIWTSFIVIARASAGHTLNAFDLAFVRITGAGSVLLPLGWWLGRRELARGGQAGWLGLSPYPLRVTAQIGLFGGLLYAVLGYAGFFSAPAAHASVLMPGSLPLWTALLAAAVLGTRITPARALGLLLIVAGDLFVGGASLLKAFDGGSVWKGDLLFIAAASCWATYTVLARRHALDAVRGTIAITVFAFVVYVPAYALLAVLNLVPSRLADAPAAELLFQAAFQRIGSVAISGTTFTKMIQYFGPVRSTMITAVVPSLSALGAVIFLNELMSWNLIAGLALVTLGIVFGVRAVASAGAALPAARPAA